MMDMDMSIGMGMDIDKPSTEMDYLGEDTMNWRRPVELRKMELSSAWEKLGKGAWHQTFIC